MTTSSISSPQSVERIFSVLEHLAMRSGEGVSLADLARVTGAPKSSLVSLLAGMVAIGHVVKDDSGLYFLGALMYSLSMRIVGTLNLASMARPVLEALMEETGETVLLGSFAPSGDLAMYIDKVESRSALRYTVSLGEQRDLYSSAIGKLLLAYTTKERQDAYLRTHALVPYTDSTIKSPEMLRRQLREIVAQGYAITVGERVVGADAMAAPVFGYGHEVVAALVVAGPSERMRANRASDLRHLRTAATALSKFLASGDRLRPAA